MDNSIIGETRTCIYCGEMAISHNGHVHADNSDLSKSQFLLAGWCKDHQCPTQVYNNKCRGCCGYLGHFNSAGI